MLRQDSNEDSARHQHNQPRNVEHDVSESNGWEYLANKFDGRVGEGVNDLKKHNQWPLGSEPLVEYSDPVNDESCPEHIRVDT